MTDPAATPLGRAAQAQARASAPAACAWVGASAGSGKTKVLTDRVLRLLLEPGADPRRILCLTFTRAGAAEMATRLARELGRWAVADDAALAAEVGRLTGRTPREGVGAETLARARALLARVLEAPGGMRIATIHSFCQSLLRSFPLEADLPPQFRLMDERDAGALLAEVREAVLAGAAAAADPDLPAAVRSLAGLVPAERFGTLVKTLAAHRGRLETAAGLAEGSGVPAGRRGGFATLPALLAAALGLAPRGGGPALDEAAVVADASLLRDAADRPLDSTLLAAARVLEASGNAGDQGRGREMLAWLTLPPEGRAARWAAWSALFLTDAGTVRRTLATRGGLVVRQDEAAYRAVLAALEPEAERVVAVEARRRTARLHAATAALLRLAGPVLEGYEARKRQAGLLDYDDLVVRARAILSDPGSAWVLFKLDGGLDHVLLDESQDSNAHQWGVAEALTAEFFAGAGAHDGPPRTVFAVGDPKQSIFGFQGADAGGFHTWRDRFAGRLRDAGGTLEEVRLDVSFRSTAPVLALVDAVFADELARPGVAREGDDALRHVPAREGQAGRVELWPAFPRVDPPALADWLVPEPLAVASPEALLAEALAARIQSWLARGEWLPARGRAMRAGDVLVLVQKRNALVQRLVRALKDRGVPVGGVDRMRLVEQIAVQDLLALLDVVLAPRDDLALAALLRSPLCDLSDEALFALAHGRGRASLWERLAAARAGGGAVGAAADRIAAAMARADLVTPHALLAGVLGEDGGRARLLARLGPDAADPLDELLSAALAYEARHPPSLQGFVHWLRRGGAEVKREAEAAADVVRIMTVHGSKGLQAPVVVLPDVGPGAGTEDLRWTSPDETGGMALPLWASGADLRAPAFNAALRRDDEGRAEETNRLLYVALTRAEDRLLVAGLTPARAPRDGAERWHPLVARGFGRLRGREGFSDAEPFDPAGFGGPDVPGLGPVLAFACPQAAPPDRAGDRPAAAPGDDRDALPAWATTPAPAEAATATVQPSALPGEAEGPAAAPHGAADPAGVRFRRGRLVHALLQHLPDRAPAERAEAARLYLARPGHGLDAAERALIRDEALALLDHPDLAAAFGPDALAEAPVAGRIGSALVAGQVDRLLVAPGRVTVLDYKTNRPPPATPEAVAPPYLRQMAAYRAVLRRAFPGRAVACVLVWTYGARAMPLPDALLDLYAPAGDGG